MYRKLAIVLIFPLFITGCGVIEVNYDELDKLFSDEIFLEDIQKEIYSFEGVSEYCLGTQEQIGMSVVSQTPEEFLNENEAANAAINGVYYGADDDLPQGVAYTSITGDLSTGKGLISGYLGVTKDGNIVVSQDLSGALEKYDFVIGTHPLLVTRRDVHQQARDARYNYNDGDKENGEHENFRSALGTKDGTTICFVVSNGLKTMSDWAEELLSLGFTDAISLDGGPISQLAIRENNAIRVEGGGGASTRLIIYAY